MVSIRSGILGGFLATLVIGGITIMNNDIGLFPDFRIIRTLSEVFHTSLFISSVIFLVVGIFVFGALYAFLAPRIPFRSPLMKGLLFGIGTWLTLMLTILPLDHAGLFGLERGPAYPAVTLALNLIYGVILGMVYAWDTAPVTRVRKIKT